MFQNIAYVLFAIGFLLKMPKYIKDFREGKKFEDLLLVIAGVMFLISGLISAVLLFAGR